MRNTPLRLRVLSAATALALISSCSLPAFAGTFYLEDGSITVTAGEDGNDVEQGGKTTYGDTDTVISNKDKETPTDNTITIKADKGETVDVTLDDVNIKADDRSAVTAEGAGTVRIELDGNNTLEGGDASKNDGDGYAGLEKKDAVDGGAGRENDGTLIIKDDNGKQGSLTATGTGNSAGIGGVGNKDGKKSGEAFANDAGRCSENIEIEGGDITAIGSGGGAGIGGGKDGFGKVTIKGGNVTAIGGENGGAGIGGGQNVGWSGLGEVEISGGNIKATGGGGGAGIGGGDHGDAKVTITGGKVDALGGEDGGAGIGNGNDQSYNGSYVTIKGGNITAASNSKDGVAIGGNSKHDTEDHVGMQVSISGGTITATTDNDEAAIRGDNVHINANDNILQLDAITNGTNAIIHNNEGPIALGDVHKGVVYLIRKANQTEILVKHNSKFSHVWEEDSTGYQAPTCTADGHRTFQCASADCTSTYTQILSATGHDWDNGTTENGVTTYHCKNGCGATYTTEKPADPHIHNFVLAETIEPTEEKEGQRIYRCSCNKEYAEPIPKLEHAHNYTEEVARVEPTCGEEGYIILVCTADGDENRVPLPATGQHSWDAGVVTKEPTTESAGEKVYTCTVCGETYTETIPMLDSSSNSITAWYRVASGAQDYTLTCQLQIAGDTCTFTTDLENATLSGNFAYLQQLYAQGVRTLCFTTANHTTRLSLDALLARGEEESVFALAHTGADAALTVDGQAVNELLG